MPLPQFLIPDSSPPNCGTLPPDECSPPAVLATPPPYPLLPPPPPPPSPSSASSHGQSTFVTALIVAGSVLAFLALCLSAFLFVRRMRQRRRQREALLEAAALDPAAPGLGEEIVHHAWQIRTVGLDEAAIESVALTRYRAPGGGGGGAASDDCTVCLGEFRDGELLRLLPQCAHAFHVQCIDTWLRVHVSCPLCRATVMLGPAALAAAEQHDDPAPPAAGNDDAEQEQDAGNVGTPEHEQQPVHHADEQLAQIERREQESSSPERPHRRPIPRTQNFRRVASMDSPWLLVSAGVEAREHEQAGGAKQGTCDVVCREVSLSPGPEHLNRAAMKRSLSAGSRWTLLSRHCRTRTSLLPL